MNLRDTRPADVVDHAKAFLQAEGVDVERELAAVARAEEAGKHRITAAADRARDLALNLKAAERALLREARGVNSNATGFTAASLGEAQERVNQLRAALEEACMHDRDLARQVQRQVA